MKKLIVIIAFALAFIYTKSYSEQYLYPVVDGKAVGYINSKGEVIIPVDYYPDFDYTYFSVMGKPIKKFELPLSAYFSDGYVFTKAPLRIWFIRYSSKGVLLDADGNVHELYDDDYEIGPYVKNVAPVKIYKRLGDYRYSQYYGFINKDGEIIARDSSFEYASKISEGLSLVLADNLFGFATPECNFKINPQFENAEPFSEGLAQATSNTLWGYINKQGTFVIPEQFYASWKFSNGFAKVLKNRGELYYYIDRTGKRAWEKAFVKCSNFSEGLASVEYEGKYGYLDTTGNFAIKPEYLYAGDFSGGLAPVATLSGWGFINNSGHWVISPDYDYVEGFDHALALAWKNGELYYINKKGERVYKFKDYGDN